ncbi:MAG: hypothetical protein QM784_37250 [Polyangiaceae bacterium]
MALLTNPTLRQLQLIKRQNLDKIFESGGLNVDGVGIGPQTVNAGTVAEIHLNTTGANTIVIVVHSLTFVPWFDELVGTDDDESTISVVPSYVAGGFWNKTVTSRYQSRLIGPTYSMDLDGVVERSIESQLTQRATAEEGHS